MIECTDSENKAAQVSYIYNSSNSSSSKSSCSSSNSSNSNSNSNNEQVVLISKTNKKFML